MANDSAASEPLDEIGVDGIEAIREIRDRLTALIEASPATNASDGQHWRPAPAPLPNLTPAEAQRANTARCKVMADVRAHPARSATR